MSESAASTTSSACSAELEAIWLRIVQSPPLGLPRVALQPQLWKPNQRILWSQKNTVSSDLRDSTQLGGCIASTCAPKEIQLNVSTLSDLKSLMPSVTLASYTIPAFSVLVDSGSSDCFINMNFVNKYSLSTYSVPPLKLCLFDGTTNSTIT